MINGIILIDFLDLDKFTGSVVHSHDYRDPENYRYVIFKFFRKLTLFIGKLKNSITSVSTILNISTIKRGCNSILFLPFAVVYQL